MIRIMPSLLVALATAPAMAAERKYTLADFDRVQVEGPFRVSLKTGAASSAKATGSADSLDRVSVDVQGRTLRIRQNRSAWGGYPGGTSGPVRIELTTSSLRSASVNGSGSLAIDKARGMRLDLALSGTGRIGLTSAEADLLSVGLLGSGTIYVGGRAKTLRATVQGAGNFEAAELSTDDANIDAATAGRIEVAVRRAATITSTGEGDTRIIGNPSCTVKQTGSGQVSCGKSD